MKIVLSAGLAAAALIVAGHAGAADLSYPKAPPMAAAPAFSWTGCRVGTHAGMGSGHTTMRDPVPNGNIDATMTGQTANTDMSGGLFGGQIGCDYQFGGNWVTGLEGSLSTSNITGTNQDQFNFNWTLRARTDWLGSATSRFGWAIDRALVYGRAGAAAAHNNFEIENGNINLGQPSATRWGWTVGSGIEWAFAANWSVFLEANYYRFADKDVRFQGNIPLAGNPPFIVRTKESIEALKFGVNYRL